MASAMYVTASFGDFGNEMINKRTFSFAALRNESYPCTATDEAAESCLSTAGVNVTNLVTCITEAEEDVSCDMVAACADENVPKDTCESELEDAFECYGCGKICEEDREDLGECIEEGGMKTKAVEKCFVECVGGRPEPESCEAGCTILDTCTTECLAGACKSDLYTWVHCHLSHYGVDCTADCPAETSTDAFDLKLSQALRTNLRA
eukprot:CAMPEP_0172551138 /NCGR_PEP_ID=MMETSP1067-20121228/36641_1 /TAXON_ID=265564 ORGANISM="Thalassiosira punctigera, Strain Tpunct2005C2" /NCGR_SAMPLE_ID=MMETSP1067 /ASSEMBLY_ACC=CAM_ASM_000444 /LENGTH=206 /DNA_ID=CAMNT_0013338883 /DNA_START=107 /DNA_END=727 /DNA_ORIENTATION=+